MSKKFSTLFMAAFVGLTGLANASAEMSTQEDLARPRRGGFLVSWRDAYTGESVSGWVRSNRPSCDHGVACACGGSNYCGTYQAGGRAYVWDRGCYAQPRLIICEVR